MFYVSMKVVPGPNFQLDKDKDRRPYARRSRLPTIFPSTEDHKFLWRQQDVARASKKSKPNLLGMDAFTTTWSFLDPHNLLSPFQFSSFKKQGKLNVIVTASIDSDLIVIQYAAIAHYSKFCLIFSLRRCPT